MRTLFQKMLDIVGESAGIQVNEQISSSPAFMEKNAESFFESDREVIQHETMAGDEYIWILQGNGSGTVLEHSAELCAETKICAAHDKSKFYLIKCTGPDQGEIEKITQAKALLIANKNRGFFDHPPVRQDIIESISDYTGIDKLSLQEMNLLREILRPSPGENIFLRFQYDDRNNKVVIDMAKPHVVGNDPQKRKHTLFVFSAKNREITEKVKSEGLFLKIKPCSNASRGKATEVTESEFEAADKASKIKKRENPELTF